MEIAEIKAKLNILTVLEQYGRKPDRNGMIRCLFHEDKTPSMKVYTDTNTVYCFSGNCGKGGKLMDGIEVLQQVNNVSKHEALKQATALVSNGASSVQTKPIIQTENLTEIFTKLKQSLYSSSKARAYAESRNIYSAKLEAGYNNGTHYSKLKNCIIFPLKNKQNNIVSFYGRNIESKSKDDRHF